MGTELICGNFINNRVPAVWLASCNVSSAQLLQNQNSFADLTRAGLMSRLHMTTSSSESVISSYQKQTACASGASHQLQSTHRVLKGCSKLFDLQHSTATKSTQCVHLAPAYADSTFKLCN